MTCPLHVWMPNILGNSGSDVFIQRLADGLRARGITVSVDWFARGYEFLPEALVTQQMPEGVDIIHSNGLNAFAFRRHRKPIVVSEHHYVLDPAYRSFKTRTQHIYQCVVTGRASKRSFRAAAMLVSPSDFTRKVLAVAAPETPQAMVPLWVDTEVFSPRDAVLTPGEHPPFRLLFVGNRSFRKGADIIPELAEKLGPGYEILCTGGLRGGAESIGSGSVRFLGRLSVSELVDAYRDCDAVVVPSRYEGFGYSALEGMACGKPVIGFACGAVDEIVEHGVTGFMLPIGDIDGMAVAARKLSADRVLLASMGRAGRQRALAVFSEERGVRSYLEIYRSLLKRSGK